MLQDIKKLLERNALTLAIIATIVVAVLSLISVPKLDFGMHIKSSDKYLHAIAYFTLSFVWYFALHKKLKKGRLKIFVVFTLIIYGIILEGLQGRFTNYRTADFFDIIANIVGVLLATILFDRIMKWYQTI